MRTDRSISRNARALKRLQERKRKRSAPSAQRPSSAAPAKEPRAEERVQIFSDTLVLTFPHKETRRWFSVPMALTLHVVVIVAFILVPILMPPKMEPELVPLYLTFAPPPPPPLKRGSPFERQRPADEVPKPTPDKTDEQEGVEQTLSPDRLTWAMNIPEEILKPKIELEYGVEEGFDFGHPLGMEGGVPGGVVGGVPGGIVGGVIGGTGTGVPGNLPQPDVGPQPIRMPRPTYTVEAIRKKISGDVVLRVLIDVKGRVRVLEVLHSIPELDREAIRVVETQWLFRPAMKQGRPIASFAQLRVSFNLY